MKPLKTSLLLLVVAALAAGGYTVYRNKTTLTPEQRYRLESAEKGDLVQTVSANGTLNPVVLVSVGTQVSGTVTQLYVDFNDKVEKGQPLLELDRSLLEAQARQSTANLSNVRASLQLARANETRMQALFKEEYVSRQELEQAVQIRKSTEAQLAQARAAADRDRVNLGYTIIRSPVSGIVVDRVVDLGQTVAASLQTPTLIKIAQDLAEMRIDSSFAEADIGRIKEGQPVHFTVDAFPDRSFTGEVQQIRLNATTTQNVVTYNVRVSLKNPDLLLLPGMTAYVTITVDRRDDVLMVPNAALRFKPEPDAIGAATGDKPPASASSSASARQRGNGRQASGGQTGGRRSKKNDSRSGTVWVLDGQALKPVAVEIGISDNRSTEIVGGELSPGDRVVVGDQPSGDAGKPSSVGLRLF